MRAPCETLKSSTGKRQFISLNAFKKRFASGLKKHLGLHGYIKVLPFRFGQLQRPFLFSLCAEVGLGHEQRDIIRIESSKLKVLLIIHR